MKFNGDDATAFPDRISGLTFNNRGMGVRVKPEDFMKILSKSTEPLVVVSGEGFFTKIYKYATAYKGFVFFTESLDSLKMDSDVEIIYAQNLSSEL